MSIKETHEIKKTFQLSTFYIEEYYIGVHISAVQEINKNLDITKVYLSEDSIAGVVNLRGDILTILDIRKKLNLPEKPIDENTRNIILNYEGMKLGIIADKIDEVIVVNENEITKNLSNIGETEKKYFEGVIKLENKLLVILNIEALLE